MRVLSSILKVGIGGGALYFAVGQNLFSANQKVSIEASRNIINSLPGLGEEYTNKVGFGITKNDLVNYWNSGVKTAVSALANVPTSSKEVFGRGMGYVSDEIKNQLKKTS